MADPLILTETPGSFVISDPTQRLMPFENRMKSNGFYYTNADGGQWLANKGYVKDPEHFRVIVQRILDLEANPPPPESVPTKVDFSESGSDWVFRGPKRLLKKVSDRLTAIGLKVDQASLQTPEWVYRAPKSSLTPAKVKDLQAMVGSLNSLPAAEAEPRIPPPNTSKYVRLDELDGKVYISGPKHLMTSDPVYKRLKSQGFTFNPDILMWVAPAHSLSPTQRKNMEKLLTPYMEGGTADLRTPEQKRKEELDKRMKAGWGIKIPFSLKDEAKSLGGLWNDPYWAMPDQKSYDAIKEKLDDTPAARAQREITRRRQEHLCFQIPYDFKDKARELGGLWDPDTKQWCMPDRKSYDEVLALVQAQKDELAKEVARKHMEQEQEKANAREKLRLERQEKGIVEFHGEGHGPSVGTIFRDRKSGKVLQVLEVKPFYIREDGMSFGYDFDSGWVYTMFAGPPKDEHKQDFEKKEEAERVERETKAQAVKRRNEIAKQIQQHGTWPPGHHVLHSKDMLVADRGSRIYGGGSWFNVEPDGIWYCRGNGADGDDWSMNNVRTGGAGAIGYKIPYNKELAEEIEELDKLPYWH